MKMKMPHLSQEGFLRFTKRSLVTMLMVILVFTGSGVLYLFGPFTKTTEAAWFNDDWAFRKILPLTTVTAGRNVYISKTIDTSDTTRFKSDCSDLRFTRYSGELLPYYVVSGCGGASTVVHILVNDLAAVNQDIYMYYGNPNAPYSIATADFSSAATATAGTLGSEEVTVAPIFNWRFDEGYGTTTKDSSGTVNTGTLGGATVPTWQPEDQCMGNKCLYFNGSTSKVTGSKKGLGIQTIAFWVRPNTIASQGLMDLDGGTHKINTSAGGVISAAGFTSPTYYLNGIAVTSLTLVQNQWNFVEITTGTAFSSAATTDIKVGTDGTNFLKGIFDEVKIYNFARSAAQVKTDFVAGSNRKGLAEQAGQNAKNSAGSLSNGLVGYWKMEEASWATNCSTTSVLDSSGNGNNGAACPNGSAAAITGAGKFGNGGNFDGVNDYVEVAHNASLAITGDMTISAWVNITDFANYNGIVGKTSTNKAAPYDFYLDQTTGIPKFYRSDGSNAGSNVDGTTAPASGSWQHIVVSMLGTTVTHYLNGGTNGTGSLVANIGDTGGTLRIGSRADGATLFKGKMDDVRIYKRALSTLEVSQLYKFGPGPVAEWKFEEGAGTTIHDTSTNGFDANIPGTSTWADGKYGGGFQVNYPNGAEVTDNYLLDPTNAITVEMWTNAASFSHDPDFISKGTYNMLQTNGCGGGDTWCFTVKIGGVTKAAKYDSSTFTLGNWYHLTGTYDGANVKFYVNGVLVDSTAATGTIDTNNWCLAIGDLSDGSDCSNGATVNAKYDEVRIFNYARTPGQITEDMNGGHPLGGSPVGSATGYWKFDEGYGNTTGSAHNNGSAGSALDGTITGMASPATSTSGWTQAGKFSKALVFDGSNDYVTMPSDVAQLKITGDLTLSAWINITSLSATNDIICKYTGTASTSAYCLQVNTSGKLIMKVVNATGPAIVTTTGNKTLSTATWYHVAGVFTSASSVTLYVNGVQDTVNTTSIPTTLQNPTTILNIGAENAGTNPMNGTIDEVKIYSGALTQDQINVDYNHSSAQALGALSDNSSYQANAANQEYCVPGDATSCVAPVKEWRFDEKNGSTLNDSSGNAGTGTWSGTLGSQWASGKQGAAGNFNGSDNYVDVTTMSDLLTGTIETWINPTSLPGSTDRDVIYSFYEQGSSEPISTDDKNLFINSSGIIKFRIYDGAAKLATSTTAVQVGKWYHVVATIDGTNIKLYVNGMLEGTTAATSSFDFTAPNFRFAPTINGLNDSETTSTRFNGKIDATRIFNYVRTPAQINWDYNKGAPFAFWKFDDCQGTTLKDAAANLNPATITIGGSGTQASAGTCATASTAWGNGVTGSRNYSLNFDGTDDYANTTAALNLSGTQQLTVAFWLKWTTFANDDALAMEYSTNYNSFTDSFVVDPNESGFGLFNVSAKTAQGNNIVNFTRPTAGAWHHYVIVFDRTVGTSTNIIRAIYLDGISQTLTNTSNSGDNNGGGTFWGNRTFYFMSRAGASLFGKGQLDDLRFYSYIMTAAQAKSLYNQGAVNYGPTTGAP